MNENYSHRIVGQIVCQVTFILNIRYPLTLAQPKSPGLRLLQVISDQQ
jgi:hypothetical protein